MNTPKTQQSDGKLKKKMSRGQNLVENLSLDLRMTVNTFL